MRDTFPYLVLQQQFKIVELLGQVCSGNCNMKLKF